MILFLIERTPQFLRNELKGSYLIESISQLLRNKLKGILLIERTSQFIISVSSFKECVLNDLQLPNDINIYTYFEYPLNMPLYELVDKFNAPKCLKQIVGINPNIVNNITFNTITEHNFEQYFPGIIPKKESRNDYIYKINPSLLKDENVVANINKKMIILSKENMSNCKDYCPEYAFPLFSTLSYITAKHEQNYSSIFDAVQILFNRIDRTYETRDLFTDFPENRIK